MLTSKMLRALAPVPAVMESPREAMMSMSAGRSWCTVRWAGGWRSLVIIIFIIMVIIIVIIIDDVDVRRSKLVHRAVGGRVALLGGQGDYGDDVLVISKDRQTETRIEALVVDDFKITVRNGVSTAP